MRGTMINLLVLAGGLGTRLRDVVSNVPKPMAPIGRIPFLQLLLDGWLAEHRLKKIYMSVGYKHEVFVDFFNDAYSGVEIQYFIEKTPLGTGGAAVHAIRKIKAADDQNPLICINGDTYLVPDTSEIDRIIGSIETFDFCLGVSRKDNRAGRYTPIRGGCHEDVFTGVIGIGKNISDKITCISDTNQPSPFSLEELIFGINRKAQFSWNTCDLKDEFLDIGIPEDYLNAQSFINEYQNKGRTR